MKSFKKTNRSLLDFFSNLKLSFVILFLIALMMINPIAKNADITSKAEFIITIEWPDNSEVDIDTWIIGPDKSIVSFKNKKNAYLHLDRDDLGSVGDTVSLTNGQVIDIISNREVVTIRGIVPGKYVFNLFYYRKRGEAQTNLSTDITVEFQKINPYRVEYKTSVTLDSVGQEITVMTFEVDRDGTVYNLNVDEQIPFAKSEQGQIRQGF